MGLLVSLASLAAQAGALSDTPPPGTFFRLTTAEQQPNETFKSQQPIVGTSYFYWYDVYTGAHIVDPDGTDAMTTHPPVDQMADLSYRSVAWHRGQLADVIAAGIDFIMPVFWGVPGQYDDWSFVGLRKLIEADDELRQVIEQHPELGVLPKIGMFYDTSTLRFNGRAQPIDLTTEAGREWFYVTIRDYWSLVPPRRWARIDGKPIVFLYAAEYAAAVDEKLFDETRRRFQADFGTDLFLIRHADWPGRADACYLWGGAQGLRIGDHVAALGPGYDDSAVCGRHPTTRVDRLRGAFYDRQWENLLRINPSHRPWIVHVETWNEWHEGTDTARSQDANDLYMRATAKFAGAFHAGVRLDPYGPFVKARTIHWSGRSVGGLYLRPSRADGCWERTGVDQTPAVVSVAAENPAGNRYLYFDVDDSCVFGDPDMAAEVTVVFRDDGGCERFKIEYDGSDASSGPMAGAFRPSPAVHVGQSGTWRTVTMQLSRVWFCNRANGADLRLSVEGGKRRLTVSDLILRKLPGILK